MQIDKGRLLHETLARLRTLKNGEGLLLQPYKRDRAVCIVALDGRFHVMEQGFDKNEFLVEAKKIKKLLKTLCKKEFPRSNKVWLKLLSCEELAEFRERLCFGAHVA